MAAVAAIFHILNHDSFKAALFMTAGIVDHETGTRDLRQLGGLWRFMPWTATLAMVAAAAMAGVPLFNGFLSKEMFLTEAVAFAHSGGWRWLVPAAATLAALCSVAYSIRLVHDIFFNGPPGNLPHAHPHEPPLGMKTPVILLAVICVVVGVLPSITLGPLVLVASAAMLGQAPPEFHLAIWHGFNVPLALSALALAGGAVFYLVLARARRLHGIESEGWFGAITGQNLFTTGNDRLFGAAGRITSLLETGSLQRYIAWTLLATLAVALGPMLLDGNAPGTGPRALLPANLPALVVWGMLMLACVWLVARHHSRFESVVVTGVVGLVTALCFVSFSAPDLALTQLTVEAVSTVILLMGLALLPKQTPHESTTGRRARDAFLALGGGAGIACLSWVMLTRDHDSIAWYFLNQSAIAGGGTNVVNVILVDFRGYDTMGEITVLGIAAVGVFALMDGMRTKRPNADDAGRSWTFAVQPLMLRVAARVVLPLALVVTLYIFMRGHNMPGGGFIAGLITAVALVLQYMALGQNQAGFLLRVESGRRFIRWIAYGLGIAGLTGVGAFVFGQPFLTSAHGHPFVPILGELPLATAALFDLGVYVTVVGSTLLTIATLSNVTRGTSAAHAPERDANQAPGQEPGERHEP